MGSSGGSSGGGGGGWPTYSGSGTPEGVVTAAATSDTYSDTNDGAAYLFVGTPGQNTGWVLIGGGPDQSTPVAGFGVNGTNTPVVVMPENGTFEVQDSANLTGFSVFDSVNAGTSAPPVTTFYSTLDDGNGGADIEAQAASTTGIHLSNQSTAAGIVLLDQGGHGVVINANGAGPITLGLTGDVLTALTDLNFADNTMGPVITDQSDGHTYRIISTAGILSTVQVT